MKFLIKTLSCLFFLFIIHNSSFIIHTSYAIYNPTSVPNNKFGIHIISPTPEESSPAASLVNTNGDWGYITLLVESKDRDQNKWQQFFNDLRRRHLIPIVRLATKPEGNTWKRPYAGEEQAWADFLDNLAWPTKNRYVVIYNEPNHGNEWGGEVDPKNYAQVLNKTIEALKKESEDFFVLNAGFDSSAPQKQPAYMDQVSFMKQMNEEVPGIFNKLDGWASHSYPNPNFSGSPTSSGRGSVKNYLWELEVLADLGVTKILPVFITETGWKHSEGISFDKSLLTTETIAQYFKQAFEQIWVSPTVVAITPFLLNYQDSLFDHFSFKKIKSSDFYPQFFAIQDLPKTYGKPVQENQAELVNGTIYKTIVAGETYTISLTFKNTGQSIWSEKEEVKLAPISGRQDLGVSSVKIPSRVKVEPGQDYTFQVKVTAPASGSYKVILNLFEGIRQFQSPPVEFTTEVKSPVILKINSSLKWKKNFSGQYLLKVVGAIGESISQVILGSTGVSQEIEARNLLPDYTFDFTLEKPYYKPKTIRQTVRSGTNTLEFGELKPDIPSAILNPRQLWKLLPWSD